MPEISQKWGTTEWEKYARHLVNYHHGIENVISVPDKHKGDHGIECFSISGIAYQMYAAQGVSDTANLYEKQRNKINKDIKKFMNNKDNLINLFNDIKIKRWVLLVPENVSSDLVKYASRKTNEVKEKHLDYVSEDFRILIKDETDFSSEKTQLINAGILLYRHPEEEIDEISVKSFDEEDEEGVNNLTYKIKNNHTNIEEKKFEELKYLLIKEYIYGNNIIDHLHSNFPELWQEVRKIKKMREESLLIESIDNKTTLINEIDKISHLYKELNKLHIDTIEHLAREAISDWLMRCPLDFKE